MRGEFFIGELVSSDCFNFLGSDAGEKGKRDVYCVLGDFCLGKSAGDVFEGFFGNVKACAGVEELNADDFLVLVIINDCRIFFAG